MDLSKRILIFCVGIVAIYFIHTLIAGLFSEYVFTLKIKELSELSNVAGKAVALLVDIVLFVLLVRFLKSKSAEPFIKNKGANISVKILGYVAALLVAYKGFADIAMISMVSEDDFANLSNMSKLILKLDELSSTATTIGIVLSVVFVIGLFFFNKSSYKAKEQ